MKLERVTLLTGKMNETRHFYTELFGFALLQSGSDHFTFKIGTTALTFKYSEEYENPYYHFAINIPENKLLEVKDWVSSRVCLIQEDGEDEAHFESWNADSIYIEDPSGNIVEFIARHNLPNGTSHPFSAEDCQGVSEVGIVADEVIPFVRTLNQMGIPNWKEDSEGLTPAGDENGLFIVVKNNRVWYFSNRKKAIFYPVEVSIETVGKLKFTRENQVWAEPLLGET